MVVYCLFERVPYEDEILDAVVLDGDLADEWESRSNVNTGERRVVEMNVSDRALAYSMDWK